MKNHPKNKFPFVALVFGGFVEGDEEKCLFACRGRKKIAEATSDAINEETRIEKEWKTKDTRSEVFRMRPLGWEANFPAECTLRERHPRTDFIVAFGGGESVAAESFQEACYIACDGGRSGSNVLARVYDDSEGGMELRAEVETDPQDR